MFSLQLPQHPHPPPTMKLEPVEGLVRGRGEQGLVGEGRATLLTASNKHELGVGPSLVNSLCGLRLGIFSL